MKRLALLLLCPGIFGSALNAQPAINATTRARSAPVLTVYIENDLTAGTDQHYTNGIKFSWLTRDLVDWGYTGWRKTFVDHLPFVNRPDGQKDVAFALGQNMYTPRDIAAPDPDKADRPYAGWLYTEIAFISKTPKIADTFSIQVGMVGPASQAEDAQRIVHQWLGRNTAKGWDHQLRNELGVNIGFERRWRMLARSLSQTIGIDFVPHLGASLGNVQTYLNGGGTVRFGMNLPSDFGVELARPGAVGGSPTDDEDPRVAFGRNFSVFGFGAADGRAVARDIFLDGNTFRDSASVDKDPLVADLSTGFGVIAGRWQLTYTKVWRTREFTTERGHYNIFSSLTLSRAF